MEIVFMFTGLFLIIIALGLMMSVIKEEKLIYSQISQKHSEIIEYSNVMDEILSNFDDMLDVAMEKFNTQAPIAQTQERVQTQVSQTQDINYVREELEQSNVDEKIERVLNFDTQNNEDSIVYEETQNEEDIMLEMHDRGMSSNQIAKELGKGIREVEILLKLKKMSRS